MFNSSKMHNQSETIAHLQKYSSQII